MGAARQKLQVELGTVAMDASNGLPAFYHEFATAEVPGVGEVRVGIHANLAAVYVMLPAGLSLGRDDQPPHLFIVRMQDLVQPVLDAAIARHRTGEPVGGR